LLAADRQTPGQYEFTVTADGKTQASTHGVTPDDAKAVNADAKAGREYAEKKGSLLGPNLRGQRPVSGKPRNQLTSVGTTNSQYDGRSVRVQEVLTQGTPKGLAIDKDGRVVSEGVLGNTPSGIRLDESEEGFLGDTLTGVKLEEAGRIVNEGFLVFFSRTLCCEKNFV